MRVSALVVKGATVLALVGRAAPRGTEFPTTILQAGTQRLGWHCSNSPCGVAFQERVRARAVRVDVDQPMADHLPIVDGELRFPSFPLLPFRLHQYRGVLVGHWIKQLDLAGVALTCRCKSGSLVVALSG
jgi:hypothetical protein